MHKYPTSPRNLQTSQVKGQNIFHNNRMFEVSRVNTPCRALQNPPYSKASECLKVMSVLKSMSVTLWKPKASLQNFATQSGSRGLWSMPFCRDYSRIENVKIKCSSTNHVNGNFLLSEGLPTKFSIFSIFEIFVQPSNFFVSKGLI